VTTWDQDQGGSNPHGHRNVRIVITEIGNDLRFDIAIIDPQNNDDLRALFFNLKDDAVSGLALKESWVGGVRQASNFASRVDANGVDHVVDRNEKLSGNYDNHKIKNPTFDIGVEFPGGNSNITAASFTLTGGDRKLALDLVGEELFGIRAHGQKLIVSGATDGVNTRPDASPAQDVVTNEDAPLSSVAIGAADRDGDPLGYGVKDGAGPQKGTVAFDQANGTFTYVPNTDASGSDSFTILVSDGRGGACEQQVRVTINPVNDAPQGADRAVTLSQGGAYTFSLSDFGFSDSHDAPSHAFKALVVTGLPAAGTLTLDGAAVTAGQAINAASLSKLVFTPAAGAPGEDHATFTFKVQDAGGTERGGQDTSQEHTFAFNIAPVQGVSHDDLIEAGDGNDTIHGGLGNDEMQGEGGNDLIIGGKDGGRLVRSDDGTLQSVVIGDNLYGNDGRDTYHFRRGDGVDMVWDFRPGEDVISLTGYKVQGATILDDPQTGYRLADVRVMFVRHVVEANDRLNAGAYNKIAVLLGSGDAILFNDFPAPSDNDVALVLGDGTLSSGDLLRMAQANAVVEGSAGTSGIDLFGPPSALSGTSVPLTLVGTNDGDTLIGAAGDDHVYGNEGANTLNGRGGHDRLYGGNTRDVLLGESGDDIGYGNGGSDLIIGGSGSDRLYGAGGDDLIFGDDGEGVDLPGAAFAPSGHGISAKIEIVNSWWGGFEGRITVAANESVDQWKLALRSHFKIDHVWGADKAGEASSNGSLLYDLDNTIWNGGLANGQTTTIGFTAQTNIAGALDPADLLRALSVATEGAPADLPPLPSSGPVETGIEVVNTWSGGFEGRITLKADGRLTHWEVLLKTKFKIDGLWGAEKAAEMSENGATVYSLDNTKWNGVLREGETVTIGFTARTGTSATLTREQILDPANLSLANDDGSVNSSANGVGRRLMGGAGNDTLFSGESKDVLSGLQGKDAFVFSSKLNAKTNVDRITDFSVKDDTINLENAIFEKAGKTGTLKSDMFRIGDKAHDASDRIIYDKKKGVLYYDADGSGSGAAVQFATLKDNLKLTCKDFFIV
jgi:Ca2+-binding RTX toxin-like protein